eukprot:m.36528 g.36528  ORF g.36528 m.36528 type:complete len:266 (+) comp32262_c0_seq2:56-853(+)
MNRSCEKKFAKSAKSHWKLEYFLASLYLKRRSLNFWVGSSSNDIIGLRRFPCKRICTLIVLIKTKLESKVSRERDINAEALSIMLRREDETFSQRTSLILGVRLGAPQLEVGNKAVIEVSLKNEEEVRKPAVSCELGIPAGLQVDEEDFRTQCQSNESLKAFKLDSSTLLLFLTLDKAQEISFSVPVTAAYAGRFTGQPSFAVQLSNPSSGKVWAQCLAVEIGASYLPIPPPPPSPPPTQQEEEEKDDAKEDSPEEDASAKKPLE